MVCTPRIGHRAGGNRFNTEERGASAGPITNDSVVHHVASCVSVTSIIGYFCPIEMPDDALALSTRRPRTFGCDHCELDTRTHGIYRDTTRFLTGHCRSSAIRLRRKVSNLRWATGHQIANLQIPAAASPRWRNGSVENISDWSWLCTGRAQAVRRRWKDARGKLCHRQA